jgi:hypothetical protein
MPHDRVRRRADRSSSFVPDDEVDAGDEADVDAAAARDADGGR